MRNISKLLIAVLFPVCALAQSPGGFTEEAMPVLCGKTADFMKVIAAAKEKLSWSAKEHGGLTISFWESDKTYTVLKTDRSGEFSCVVSDGALLPKL